MTGFLNCVSTNCHIFSLLTSLFIEEYSSLQKKSVTLIFFLGGRGEVTFLKIEYLFVLFSLKERQVYY